MTDKKDRTDTERLDYIQSLEDPILEIAGAKHCMCGSCNGYTLRASFSGKRSYSEAGLREAIDAHMDGDLEDYDE